MEKDFFCGANVTNIRMNLFEILKIALISKVKWYKIIVVFLSVRKVVFSWTIGLLSIRCCERCVLCVCVSVWSPYPPTLWSSTWEAKTVCLTKIIGCASCFIYQVFDYLRKLSLLILKELSFVHPYVASFLCLPLKTSIAILLK